LLYGERDEPYAVLARLGQRLEAALAPEAALPTVVQTVAEALRLPYAAIALAQGDAAEVAAAHGIPSELVPRPRRSGHAGQPDRVEFTHAIVDALERHGTELVAMAGFMTILEKPIFDAYAGRVLNTHPSLLPSFKGAHAVEEALAAGVKVTGCTIHVATLEVDSGPIVAQEAVPVVPGDTAATLHERIKAVEHRLYPETIRRFAAERAAAP
jgi:phosphoribosylglycinamide formyltransferase-1